MTTPSKYIATVTDIKKLNFRVMEFTFTPVQPATLDFEPGQFITLLVAERTYRTYSIASDVKDNKAIKIVVTVAHEGVGSNYLKRLKVGDTVQFIGPSGLLRLKEPLAHEISFFATGTGIAPLIPMMIHLADINFGGKVNLFFGVRNEEEMFYEELIKCLVQDIPFFNYKIYYSQPSHIISEDHFVSGRVTDELKNIYDLGGQFYLCGHPAMIEEMQAALLAKGVKEENIIFEKFIKAVK